MKIFQSVPPIRFVIKTLSSFISIRRHAILPRHPHKVKDQFHRVVFPQIGSRVPTGQLMVRGAALPNYYYYYSLNTTHRVSCCWAIFQRPINPSITYRTVHPFAKENKKPNWYELITFPWYQEPPLCCCAVARPIRGRSVNCVRGGGLSVVGCRCTRVDLKLHRRKRFFM